MSKSNTVSENLKQKIIQIILIAIAGAFFGLSLGIVGPRKVQSAPSSHLNFQARLLSGSGAIVPDGNYHVEFKLYDAVTGGSLLWTETRSTGNLVTVKNGYISVYLGSVTAFPNTINWDNQLWLTMNIGGTGGSPSWDGEMSPRIKLTAVPYAFQAGQLAKTDGANRGTLRFDTVTSNPNLLLPDESGTLCVQGSMNCGFLVGSGTAFLQGGNTFSGTTAGVLGTVNNGDLNLITNNTTRLTVAAGGNVAIDTNTLYVDATNDRVGIGTTSPSVKFEVNDGSLLVQTTHGAGNGITVTGSGSRMFFDANTSAFRAGGVSGTNWNQANLGSYSAAFGQNTYADHWGFAAGQNTWAAYQSVAFGSGTEARGLNSATFGRLSFARAENSMATGVCNIDRTGTDATNGNLQAGDGLFMVGNGTVSGGICITRSDAFTVLRNGDTTAQGTLTIQGTGTSSFAGNVTVAGNLAVQTLTQTQTITTNEAFAIGGIYQTTVASSATVGQVVGLGTQLVVDGTVTDAIGMAILLQSSAGSAITTAVGLDIMDVAHAGTVTNSYGLRVGQVSGATNNYGLYVAGASTYALWVDSGTTRLDGDLMTQGNTTLGDASNDTLTITGTTVTIPNNLNFDSNTLYIDAANNRVGIGTAAPSEALHVNGNMLFGKETNRTIKVENSTTANTAGADLSILGANGTSGAAAGGNINLTAGSAVGFTSGGAVNISGGSGVFAGGNVNIAAGSGSFGNGSITLLGARTEVRAMTDGAGVFQLQNAQGATLLSLDSTLATNVAVNGGANSNITGWTANTPATVSHGTIAGEYASGGGGVKISTTGVNGGVRNNLGAALATNTTYTVSFSIAASPSLNVGNVQVQYYRNNSPTLDSTCSAFDEVASVGFAFIKYTCVFTTTATAGNNTAYLLIRQTDGTSRMIGIDNLSIVAQNTTGTQNTGVLRVGGVSSQGLTLLTLDTYAGTPFSGTNTALAGSMYFDTTQNKIQCYDGAVWGACGAAPDNIITLSPEYTGAVLNGTGIGTMTADFCSGTSGVNINDGTSGQPSICSASQTFNFYKWTSPQATPQTYSIWATYQLPSTFENFVNGSVSLIGRTDSANATVRYTAYRNAGGTLTACGSATTVSTGVQANWQTVGPGTDLSTCSFAANNSVVFRIEVIASGGANAYVSNLNFQFSNQ